MFGLAGGNELEDRVDQTILVIRRISFDEHQIGAAQLDVGHIVAGIEEIPIQDDHSILRRIREGESKQRLHVLERAVGIDRVLLEIVPGEGHAPLTYSIQAWLEDRPHGNSEHEHGQYWVRPGATIPPMRGQPADDVRHSTQPGNCQHGQQHVAGN
jgi:hypothetical protein